MNPIERSGQGSESARDRLYAAIEEPGVYEDPRDIHDLIDAFAQSWRARAEVAEHEIAAARKYAAEMRQFCSPHGVSVHYADQLIAVMDRAKGGYA